MAKIYSPTTDMKRFDVYADTANGTGIGARENPKGMWVRAEDVAAYLELVIETLDENEGNRHELVDALLQDELITMTRDYT